MSVPMSIETLGFASAGLEDTGVFPIRSEHPRDWRSGARSAAASEKSATTRKLYS
jgi:hypothetical protein